MKASKMYKSIASSVLVMAMVVPMLASAPATTTQAAKKMTLSAKSALLTVGSTKKVKVKNFRKGSKFTWKSSSKAVATVAGKKSSTTVTAKSAGNTKISCVVKKGGKKTTVSGLTIKVRQKVSSFTMQDNSKKSATSVELKAGNKTVLSGAINNNSKGCTINQTVKWTTSNSKVATVKKKNINQATVTAVSAGTATITATVAYKSKTDKRTATCVIKVTGTAPTATPKGDIKATATPKGATPTPTDKVYPKGYVYKQENNVTRWYEEGTANGHKHDGYKTNTFAIWMVGFFDNKYDSTNEDALNPFGGPELDDYKGQLLTATGTFSYEGTAQKTVLFQINYTSPSDYPILWKWENGASKAGQSPDQKELGISGSTYGSEAAAPGKDYDVNVKFKIPTSAKNGDKDDATGDNYGIYLYFPNKPGGALAYLKDNTFHFKNFAIKY